MCYVWLVELFIRFRYTIARIRELWLLWIWIALIAVSRSTRFHGSAQTPLPLLGQRAKQQATK